ncbi:MAG: beta-propeller fold lactonase family protein, partial [Candidatus Rokubacteria bacterium]|nr:beta-propeller fold lactonase family protein [Candidatus Rokubacteria bacterium]
MIRSSNRQIVAVRPSWLPWSLAGMVAAVLLLWSHAPAVAQADLLMYVPNNTAGTVSVYRTNADGTLTAVTTITGFSTPVEATVRADQAFVYVANAVAAGTVSVIDTRTNTVVQTFTVGDTPRGLALTPNGQRLYVGNMGGGTISILNVDPRTGLLSLAGTITSTPVRELVVSPDGARLFVVSQGDDRLRVFETTNHTLVANIAAGSQPVGITINPAGTRVYVTDFSDNNVRVYDASTFTLLATVGTGSTGARKVIVSPDGTRFYVTSQSTGVVSIFNATTNALITTITSGGAQQTVGIGINPNGTFVYTTDTGALDRVQIFSVGSDGSLTSIGTIGAGNDPAAIGLCGNPMGGTVSGFLASGGIFIANSAGALNCAGTATPTFTGGTLLVNTADLAFTSALSLGTGGGTVDTNGFNASLSGGLTGTGALTKTGTGTLTLSGTNTYSGATTVSTGTLAAGATNAFSPNSAVTVSSGATLALNGFSQAIGSLAGGGAVTLGAGTLTAGGDNTSTTFSGVLSGTGGLTKSGTGTFTLSGANTFTGTTTVSSGTLTVAGSLVSPVAVASGATLGNGGTLSGAITNAGTFVNNGTAGAVTSSGTVGGSGVFGALTLTGGTVAPGNSIGTLRVNGPLTFASGASYEVEVNAAGEADLILVSGTATLNGASVRVVPAVGEYRRRTGYRILSATGGIIGTFGSVTSSLAFLTPGLIYDANEVTLILTRNDRTYASFGATGTERNVGAALDVLALSATGELGEMVDALTALPSGAVSGALRALSGESHASAQTVSLLAGERYLGLLRDRFSAARGVGAGPRRASAGALVGDTRYPTAATLGSGRDGGYEGADGLASVSAEQSRDPWGPG